MSKEKHNKSKHNTISWNRHSGLDLGTIECTCSHGVGHSNFESYWLN